MKFATKIKILIVLAVCAAVTLIAGCSIGELTWDRFLKGKNAYDKCITYSASGGIFNENTNLKLLHVYYPEENEAIYDFSSTDNLSVARTGYVFNGWAYAQLDADGNPVYDDDGYLVATNSMVDTSAPVKLEAGQHLYVCAVWVVDVRVDVILVIDGDENNTKEITGTDGTKYMTGDVIDSKLFTSGGTVNITSSTSSTASSDYTFLQYYKDEACTQVMSGSITRPTDGSTENPRIYAKYIEGVWSVVRTNTQAANMISNPVDGANYYLYTDDGSNVIDCSSRAFSLKAYSDGAAFVTNCTIAGNGVTIKNLKFTATASQGQICSVFGVFGSDANISELILENLSITITARGDLSAYLLSQDALDGAQIENVKVNGASLTVKISDGNTISNIQKTVDGYDTSKWISENELSGVEITDAKLIIGDVTVIGD